MAHTRLIAAGLRAALLLTGAAACAPSSLVDVEPSSTVVDPATINSATGARQLYNFALSSFTTRLGGTGRFIAPLNNIITSSGLFTDELMRVQVVSGSQISVGFDERTNAGGGGADFGQIYSNLHQPRVLAQQGREALRLYAPATSQALQGELYALEGFTVVYFAELFCSGIPLTTVPLSGVPVPAAGSSTEDLFERAIVLFDSAAILGADSTRFVHLANVGRGRALLGVGRYADAAAAVSGVPTDFRYLAEFDPTANRGGGVVRPEGNEIGSYVGPGNPSGRVQVVDNEGTNGLVWSTDPRAAVLTAPSQFGTMGLPAKYAVSGGVPQTAVRIESNPIRVADGVEARLIEAEAALSAGNAGWLATLNTLRATCVGAALCAPVPGIAAGALPALADPGSAAARLDLLMRERAMWLYLTMHRQGDLRRMARAYNRNPETLWPTGTYNNPGFPPFTSGAATHGTSYGTLTVFTPRARTEDPINPLYTGCNDTNP